MPFIRQTRDKRGFEQTYVMHVARSGSGSQRTRVLYLFRSPANLRVGRKPLDPEVMEALEHTHPDLSFDWPVLTREAVSTRIEAPLPRPGRGARPRPGPPSAPAPPAPAMEEPIADDPSLLGRTLGAAEAARLRRRYAEITQRIGRRARTPEERERLFGRAGRLNPDDWPDEATVRAQASRMDADCDAISAELPSRRRGRRGGRRRQDERPPGPSGIMTKGETGNADSEDSDPGLPDRAPDTGGDAGVGPADTETDLSGDD